MKYGKEGSYAEYLIDPPTISAIVKLPESKDKYELRFEYLSPQQRTALSLPAVFAGDESALILKMFHQDIITLIFSFILLLMSAALLLIALIVMRGTAMVSHFLCLALFSAAVGIWILGECDSSVFFIPYPSLLYMLSYIGMFTLPIPFLRYVLLVLKPKNKIPITAMLVIMRIAVALAVLLQLMSVIDLSHSLYIFHFLIPASFITAAICIAHEYIRSRNRGALQFAVSSTALAVSAILELINFWTAFTGTLSSFFQAGMMAFIASLSLMGARAARESAYIAAEKHRLEQEVSSIGKMLDLQREQYSRLAENEKTVMSLRHDMRHQLAVIQGFSNSGDNHRLGLYLEELTGSISHYKSETVCDNFAANTVVLHYLNLAKRDGVEVNPRLIIPKDTGRVVDSDICVILGNLLENAVEACRRMDDDRRFISIRSNFKHGVLTITMDNSFNSSSIESKGVFYSQKRNGEGIGLSSIKAAAERYDGNALFKADGKVFMSSVYVVIEEHA